MKKNNRVPKILCAVWEEAPKRSTVTAATSDQAQASQGKTPKAPPRVCKNKTKTRTFFFLKHLSRVLMTTEKSYSRMYGSV